MFNCFIFLLNQISPRMVGCYYDKISQGRSYENCNINISDCFFSRNMVFSGDGGVIYVDGELYSAFIQYSMFFNSSSTGQGGALNIFCNAINLRASCANLCTSGNSFHFSRLKASNNNVIEFLSVSSCSIKTNGHSSIVIYNGYQICKNFNSSLNNAQYLPGLYSESSSSLSLSYSTISANNVNNWVTMGFYGGGYPLASYLNIVNNNSPLGYGVIYFNSFVTMSYCIFFNNLNTLFCVGTGSLTLSHSFISHSGATSNIAIQMVNNSITSKQLYLHEHYMSYYCYADNPAHFERKLNSLSFAPRIRNNLIFLYFVL